MPNIEDHISSRPMSSTFFKSTRQETSMKEMVKRITNLSSGAQIPCNNTRVMRVKFTDPKVPESEKLCQALETLKSVTKCKDYYEPILSNLLSLHERNLHSESESEPQAFSQQASPDLKNQFQAHTRFYEDGQNCSLENGDEIYLRNFLPQLGNYTQGLIRNLRVN
ncbi:unnamed protein product [Natator depressus]